MEGKITGTGKRIMTMMLSVIMVTGIFAGIKLDVRAAKNYSFDLSSPGGLRSHYKILIILMIHLFLPVFPSHQQAIAIAI